MTAGMIPASDAQRRMLYGAARKAGMDNDVLHARCLAVTGKEHISTLTMGEAARLIDSHRGAHPAAGEAPAGDRPLDRPARGKHQRILGLARKLDGWEDPRSGG